jgi:hypothetical protein
MGECAYFSRKTIKKTEAMLEDEDPGCSYLRLEQLQTFFWPFRSGDLANSFIMSPKSSTTKSVSSKSHPSSKSAVHSLWDAYVSQTHHRLKFIDAFLVFLMLSGIAQFLYCVFVTNFPFNAFLAG